MRIPGTTLLNTPFVNKQVDDLKLFGCKLKQKYSFGEQSILSEFDRKLGMLGDSLQGIKSRLVNGLKVNDEKFENIIKCILLMSNEFNQDFKIDNSSTEYMKRYRETSAQVSKLFFDSESLVEAEIYSQLVNPQIVCVSSAMEKLLIESAIELARRVSFNECFYSVTVDGKLFICYRNGQNVTRLYLEMNRTYESVNDYENESDNFFRVEWDGARVACNSESEGLDLQMLDEGLFMLKECLNALKKW
ncbi:hypothetical protein ROZALSC1DRAFT_22740 [Rozella allomycis CSF55]|uniref:Uncharacterized protein n=1 Tax=Rozella allomycis (strain CSF55) TaxID=988480 RepID=A0A4P9YKF1_ROZAC|nr:hypothetical protein ROZALSC1DRAFT_22740 [Rozella allomycis CSF55]